MSDWGEVDAWCCIRGIDPLDLPAYRLFNVLVYMLKENLDEDQRLALQHNLEDMDKVRHPLHRVEVFQTTPVYKTSSSQRIERPVEDLSPAEQAQARAEARGKPYRVPDWYLGDNAAGRRATQMMTKLPK